jgi:hypothetical protein
MATKTHHHYRHSRRLRPARNIVCAQWLVALLARTVATIVLMVVARLLGLPTPPH